MLKSGDISWKVKAGDAAETEIGGLISYEVTLPDSSSETPGNIEVLIEFGPGFLHPAFQELADAKSAILNSRRVGPSTWLVEIPAGSKRADQWSFALRAISQGAPNEESATEPINEPRVFTATETGGTPTYTAYAQFVERRMGIRKSPFGIESSTVFDEKAAGIEAARLIFLDIDLLFKHGSFLGTTPSETQWVLPAEAKEAGFPETPKEYFADYDCPETFGSILDGWTQAKFQALANGCSQRAQARIWSWYMDHCEPEGLQDWAQLGIKESEVCTLANALASLFKQHCSPGENKKFQPNLGREAILLFAAGWARITAGAADHDHGVDYFTELSAEPDSTQFRAFAEFAQLVLLHLPVDDGDPNSPPGLRPELREVWNDIFPALVLAMEFYARVYCPYPFSLESNAEKASPWVLREALETGLDPRPSSLLIDRAVNRTYYFDPGGLTGNHFESPNGIGAIWGALLWNLDLRMSRAGCPFNQDAGVAANWLGGITMYRQRTPSSLGGSTSIS